MKLNRFDIKMCCENSRKTASYRSFCHADETSRNPNSSSYTGDKLAGPPGVPKGSEIPLTPSLRYSFHTAHICTFSRPLQVD